MPEALPRPLRLLRGATLADGRRVDVELDGNRVSAVLPAGVAAPAPADATLELDGYLLMTAPAEPHAHLDKAMSYDLIRPPQGDLVRAIESWKAYASGMTVESIADRARAAALRLLANGTTAVRCHVDILQGDEPMRGVEALVQVREELAGLMHLELVALAGWQAPDSDVEAALDRGVDLVGGASHLAPDPSADLRRLLAIAERRGVGVDLHTDEGLGGPDTLTEYARLVRDWPVTTSAGHCVRLGVLPPEQLEPLIDEVLASDIGIITLPITNLYLQGWEYPVATPRGLTALRALLDAGIRVAAGADNVRDPFNPVGRCDALETASLLVTAGHLDFEEAIALVTDNARDVMGLPAAGPVAGRVADLLAVRAENLGEAIAFAPGDRFVLSAGRLVSRTTVQTDSAAPATLAPAPLLSTLSSGR
ncbi:amidohydrolase family protein [Naasia sp. SYSU D00057]|uniref:amidohydrolase family protein n=1 Tax=Naasia sp. SYSU D00057 TaxID=2817380 RepID=UPI001B30B206|nr:amidohydrolase family protein [Naasia sp. SYSU D00057]